ncbi:hypothetical protein DR950_33340 [Kitasatospora xanthocidica]|uniref:Uncharacterized protein n=1 Tax=Kitasatospora xanthocidica TaxID=83382 RepID=A0A373A322_9ACTN|nr:MULTISPECIES: hypothetical protein [Streptomycetaceae]OKI02998.1 hypothetical protein AMK13_28500 [Streptomyces sp. CB02056]RGD61977.1 hypothetical protein DR950_33340 [Kitasatospora xanthocidica]
MPRMLDVSDEVRSEIGDDEADRLLGGDRAPDGYECTSCRTPGDTHVEPTSTVLFVGDETAVLAFAHARCIPSQVVPVSEEQLAGAVRSISQTQPGGPDLAVPAAVPSAPAPAPAAPVGPAPTQPAAPGQAAILGITCGLVLHGKVGHASLVVEPTGPVGRPGSTSGEDEFLDLLQDAGFQPVTDLDETPDQLPGWSVLVAMGKLHAILQPAAAGGSTGWWQAHQPLQVTDAWRMAASQLSEVTMYAVPAGMVGRQPREDLLRQALERAVALGQVVAASLPLAGT